MEVKSAARKYKEYKSGGGDKSFPTWLGEMQLQGKLEYHRDKSFFSANGDASDVAPAKDYKKWIAPGMLLGILVISAIALSRVKD